MKYINFKRYKFSKIYNYIDFRRYRFSKIFDYIDFRRNIFSKIFYYIDFIRYKFSKIFDYIDFRRYKFSKIFDYIDFRRYKHIPIYFAGLVVFLAIIYLSIPMFFSYEKSKIENVVCKEIDSKCSIQGKIKYSFFPSPRIKFDNFVINDFSEIKKTLVKAETAELKISFFSLYNKKQLNYKEIKLKNAEINFNLEKIKEYENFSKKKFISIPIKISNGKINFFDEKKNIAVIEDINLKYNFGEYKDRTILKGKFLGDQIYFSLENDREINNPTKTIVLKLLNSKLFTKVNMFYSNSGKDDIKGDVLLKSGQNRLTAVFDYNNSQITIKNANLRNSFTEGNFDGKIAIIPYFNFNLDMDLKRINLNKLHSFLTDLDEKNQKNLFKINNKINGQINLSVNDIYSKYTFVNSFESQLKFINGNILFDRFLLKLGKLGAADITGAIRNEKKFTNFKFESNIFLDSLKRFYNRFGVYNKPDIPSTLFVSGNFDLVNLNMRFDEISSNEKLKDDAVAYIEKEFNEIILKNNYASLFDFINLKDFVRSITLDSN